jgi:4-hydroxybenzoyl-CoA thioesterase
MRQERFIPHSAAFTRSVPIRFSHCDPAGIVYDYAELILDSRYGFPFVHIECDFKIPSRMGEIINLTLLVEHIGRSSLGIAIVCHKDGLIRLRARMVTAMMSLETRRSVQLPQALRDKIESYRQRTMNG